MSGREGRGERWLFDTLAHELAVSRGGSLAYLERYRLEPVTQALAAPWVASDACYFGTVLAIGTARATRARPGALHDQPVELSSEGLRGAVDALDTDRDAGAADGESGHRRSTMRARWSAAAFALDTPRTASP